MTRKQQPLEDVVKGTIKEKAQVGYVPRSERRQRGWNLVSEKEVTSPEAVSHTKKLGFYSLAGRQVHGLLDFYVRLALASIHPAKPHSLYGPPWWPPPLLYKVSS